MGRYAEMYEKSLADPDAFWGAAARTSSGTRRRPRCSMTATRRSTAGSPTACSTCFQRRRPARPRRPCRPGRRGVRQPGRQRRPALTYRELRDEVARFAGVLRALGGRGDRVVVYMRWCRRRSWRCSRAPARRGALGRVRRVRRERARDAHRRRGAEGDRPPLLRHRTARVVPYNRSSTRRWRRRHTPRPLRGLQRPQAVADLTPGRDIDWVEAMAEAEPVDCVPVAATDPLYVLYTSGPRRARRASCATTAATRSRCAGACRTSTTRTRARCSGRPPTSAGGRPLPTSSTRRC